MKKIFLVPLLIVLSLVISSIGLAAPAEAATTYASYTSSNGNDIFYGPYWKGQTFTPQVSHTITSVSIPLVRVGSPAGNVVVSIRATDASGQPTGSDLAVGAIACSSITSSWSPVTWYSFNLGAGYPLVGGKKYAIVWRAPSSNATNALYYSMNMSGTYSGGWAVGSSNGTWWDDLSGRAWDALFQESGQSSGTTSTAPSPAPATTSSQTTYASYTSSNGNDVFYGTYWKGQTFTPQVSHTITSISIPLVRVGSPGGNVVVSIRATDAVGQPTGSDLAVGAIACSSITSSWSPITWYSFNLGAGYPLVAGRKYAIIWRAPSSNATNALYYSMNVSGAYSGGWAVGSSNGTWWDDLSGRAWDALFRESGQSSGTTSTVPAPSPAPVPTTYSSSKFKSVGYVTIFSVASGGLSRIPWRELTHVIWQDVQVTSSSNPTLRVDRGYPWSQISATVAAGHANGVKVLAGLSGPYNVLALNNVVASNTLRPVLINNLKNLCLTYNLDGIDIDWESGPGVALYSQFVQELAAALNPLGKVVSIVGQWSTVNVTAAAANSLSFVNVMAYNYWTPSYAGTYDQVVSTMNKWANAGIAKSKLVMGIPFFANSVAGSWIPYSRILATYNPPSSQNQVTTASGEVLYWNGPDLVKRKMNYVVSNGFGGAFGYDLNSDSLGSSRSLLLAMANQLGLP